MVFRHADGNLKPPRGLRILVSSTAITASVLCCCAAPGTADPNPPPNPSDGQLKSAQHAKESAANDVGRLSALVAQASNQLQQLRYARELAEQKWALAVFRLEQAKQQAVAAQAAVAAAQHQVDQARASLKDFVRTSYISPDISSGATGLLTAADPNALLQRGDYVQFVATRHLDAVSALDRATVAKSNADARARTLVVLRQKLTAVADAAKTAAIEAVRQQQVQEQALAAQQANYQKQLAAAGMRLAILNDQRTKYVAFQAEQARLRAAREAAAAAARARARAAAEAAAEAAAAAAASAASAAPVAAGSDNSGGGGGGGQVVAGPPLPAAGSMGGWSSSKGQAAVDRAMRWLGTPYAWAAGSYSGPTFGINSPGTGGWNDSTVFGFDCSGLTMYAWAAQGLYMDHFASSQFSQAGSYHPDPGNFEPGDLLFWGLPGQASIHHVAMYIGGGNVIQAPNSGSVVQVTPWDQVSGDYFGATRPLT